MSDLKITNSDGTSFEYLIAAGEQNAVVHTATAPNVALPGAGSSPTQSGGKYDVRDSAASKSLSHFDWKLGAGQKSLDALDANASMFLASKNVEIGNRGQFSLLHAATATPVANTCGPVFVAGGELWMGRDGGGLYYSTDLGTTWAAATVGTPPDASIDAIATDGTLVYFCVSTGTTKGIWVNTAGATHTFAKYGSAPTTAAITGVTVSAGFVWACTDAGAGKVTPGTGAYAQSTGALLNSLSTVALVAGGNEIYWVATKSGKSVVHRLSYDPTTSTVFTEQYMEMPTGFVATCAVCYLSVIYVGGYWESTTDGVGKGSVYICADGYAAPLFDIGEFPEDTLHPELSDNDNRIWAITASGRDLYVLASKACYRWDIDDTGYSHVYDHPGVASSSLELVWSSTSMLSWNGADLGSPWHPHGWTVTPSDSHADWVFDVGPPTIAKYNGTTDQVWTATPPCIDDNYHKVADGEPLTATVPAASEAQDYALANELMDDHDAHTASTTYHYAATAGTTHTTASDASTLVALANVIRTAMLAHYDDATAHGTADFTAHAAVHATTIASTAGNARTLLNALAPLYIAHLARIAGPTRDAALNNALGTSMVFDCASTATGNVHLSLRDGTREARVTIGPSLITVYQWTPTTKQESYQEWVPAYTTERVYHPGYWTGLYDTVNGVIQPVHWVDGYYTGGTYVAAHWQTSYRTIDAAHELWSDETAAAGETKTYASLTAGCSAQKSVLVTLKGNTVTVSLDGGATTLLSTALTKPETATNRILLTWNAGAAIDGISFNSSTSTTINGSTTFTPSLVKTKGKLISPYRDLATDPVAVGQIVSADTYATSGWIKQSPTNFHSGSMRKDYRYLSIAHDVLPAGTSLSAIWSIDGVPYEGSAATSGTETRIPIHEQGFSIETVTLLISDGAETPVVRSVNVIWDFVKARQHQYLLDCRTNAGGGRWSEDSEEAITFLFVTASERAFFKDRFGGSYTGTIEDVQFSQANPSVREGYGGLVRVTVREES